MEGKTNEGESRLRGRGARIDFECTLSKVKLNALMWALQGLQKYMYTKWMQTFYPWNVNDLSMLVVHTRMQRHKLILLVVWMSTKRFQNHFETLWLEWDAHIICTNWYCWQPAVTKQSDFKMPSKHDSNGLHRHFHRIRDYKVHTDWYSIYSVLYYFFLFISLISLVIKLDMLQLFM